MISRANRRAVNRDGSGVVLTAGPPAKRAKIIKAHTLSFRGGSIGKGAPNQWQCLRRKKRCTCRSRTEISCAEPRMQRKPPRGSAALRETAVDRARERKAAAPRDEVRPL